MGANRDGTKSLHVKAGTYSLALRLQGLLQLRRGEPVTLDRAVHEALEQALGDEGRREE